MALSGPTSISPPDQQTISRVKVQRKLAKDAQGLLKEETDYILKDLQD